MRHRSLIVGGALSAALALAACGVEGDHGACRQACDKMAECQPSLGDSGWRSCYEGCRAEGRGPDYAACVESYSCDDAFRTNVAVYCNENPARPPRSR